MRNEIRFKNGVSNLVALKCMIEDPFQPMPLLSLPSRAPCWSPMSLGFWKLNLDAASSKERGFGGLEWIVQDHDGKEILSSSPFTKKSCDISLLEPEVILKGLIMVQH